MQVWQMVSGNKSRETKTKRTLAIFLATIWDML